MSEDIFFPDLSYKMTEIVFKDSTGNLPQSEPINQFSFFGNYSLGEFQGGGTGFIVKLYPESSLIVALTLTTAHVFMDNFKYSPSSKKFFIDQDAYLATPMKQSIDWQKENNFFIDPIANSRISIPEDWTLCELTRINGYSYSKSLAALNLHQTSSISEGQDVLIIGFPKVFAEGDLSFIAPTLELNEYPNVKNCLCGADKLICSKGKIERIGELVCVSAISCNGMSGSPVLIQVEEEYQVIGVLFGGPASEIHLYSAKIISRSSNPSRFWLKKLKLYLKGKKLTKELNFIVKQTTHIMNRALSGNKINRYEKNILLDIYSAAIEIEGINEKRIDYNNVIPLSTFAEEIRSILSA